MFKDTLITTALLGTEKKQINPEEFPNSLKPAVEKIIQEIPEQETRFLHTAALGLNYLRAGAMPLPMSYALNIAGAEDKAYCSAEAMSVLKELLSNKNTNLTWFWCKRCADRNLIVQPELLPELYEWGVATKKQWASLFSAVIGKRGAWLVQFSEEWKFVSSEEEKTDWDTSNLSQRVHLLEMYRKENPSYAIQKITSVWKEENASARLELLETLVPGLSKSDEPFLVQILTDKSQKVKEKAWQLLKLIPDSEILQQYQNILKDSIILSSGKVLGLISKTNLEIRLKLADEEIFKTGIQNLSSDKRISDENFILMQLVSEVYPEFWTVHFNCSPEEVVKMFATREELKKFQSSLVQSVLKFRMKSWAKLVIDQFNIDSVALLPLLEDTDKIRYAEQLLKVYPNMTDILNALRNQGNPVEWNYNFARQLISVMAQDPYTYANLFEGIAVYLPAAIVQDLDRFFPGEEWKRNYWQKIAQQIKEYIRLKEKIKTIF